MTQPITDNMLVVTVKELIVSQNPTPDTMRAIQHRCRKHSAVIPASLMREYHDALPLAEQRQSFYAVYGEGARELKEGLYENVFIQATETYEEALDTAAVYHLLFPSMDSGAEGRAPRVNVMDVRRLGAERPEPECYMMRQVRGEWVRFIQEPYGTHFTGTLNARGIDVVHQQTLLDQVMGLKDYIVQEDRKTDDRERLTMNIEVLRKLDAIESLLRNLPVTEETGV